MNKEIKNTETKARKGGVAKGLKSLLNGQFLTHEYVQSNLGFIFFLVGIMVCYIGYGYFAEQNMRKLVAAQNELQELKARNLYDHATLQHYKRQSQISATIQELGLVESLTPPTIITIDEEAAEKSSR